MISIKLLPRIEAGVTSTSLKTVAPGFDQKPQVIDTVHIPNQE